MAEFGRARRVRKVVDYASFADGDESDDDFVSSSTPPVAKKAKLDKPDKSSKLKSKKTEKENAKKKEKKSVNRKPPGEDLFESDLQAALELSMVEGSSQEMAHSQESKVNVTVKPIVIGDDDDEIVCLGSEPIESTSPLQLSRRTASKAAEERESFLQESESEGPSQEKKDDDEEFKLKGDESEEEEDDESDASFNRDDDDSDFDDGKKKKAKATKKQPTKPIPQKTPKPAKPAAKKPTKAAVSTPSHPKPNAKTVSKLSPSQFSSPLSNSLPATNTPKPALGTGVSRKPAWTPPAPTGSATKSVNLGGITIKSPSGGGGGLRLGLSRSQQVKPLHSSVKGAR